MDGVMSGIGHAAYAEIGGGARFDDCAEFCEVVENKLLAVADFFEALGIIWALDYFFGCSIFQGLSFGLECAGVHFDIEGQKFRGVREIVGDLVEAFADPFFGVCIGAARNRDCRVEAERRGMAQSPGAHFGGFVTPAYRAFEGFVEIAFAHVIGDFEGAFGALLVVYVYMLEECAVVFGGVAFFDIGKVNADDGGYEFGVFVQEFLHPFIVLLRGLAAQGDDVACGCVVLRCV